MLLSVIFVAAVAAHRLKPWWPLLQSFTLAASQTTPPSQDCETASDAGEEDVEVSDDICIEAGMLKADQDGERQLMFSASGTFEQGGASSLTEAVAAIYNDLSDDER